METVQFSTPFAAAPVQQAYQHDVASNLAMVLTVFFLALALLMRGAILLRDFVSNAYWRRYYDVETTLDVIDQSAEYRPALGHIDLDSSPSPYLEKFVKLLGLKVIIGIYLFPYFQL